MCVYTYIYILLARWPEGYTYIYISYYRALPEAIKVPEGVLFAPASGEASRRPTFTLPSLKVHMSERVAMLRGCRARSDGPDVYIYMVRERERES